MLSLQRAYNCRGRPNPRLTKPEESRALSGHALKAEGAPPKLVLLWEDLATEWESAE